ncbi:MAG: hypothetical protein JWP12_2464 [Bacteroidetes bacterium]|nr:hypothetical protein [Bacteroidota bacterium]
MSLTSLQKMYRALHDFEKSEEILPINTFRIKLFDSFATFTVEFDAYTNSILSARVYNHRQIADYLFLSKFNSVAKYKEYLKRSLFTANSYLKSLAEKIEEENIHKYADTLRMIRIDFEELIGGVEVNIKMSSATIQRSSGRSKFKSTTDIWGIARNLFFIENFNSINDFHLYDIKPFSVFAIRQTIEQYGKDVLGYTAITDPHGNFSKMHMYAAWPFIKSEMAKPAPRIALPFDLEVMLKIEKWSHRFVHAGYYADCYVIWQALDMMRGLFKNDGLSKRIYTGQNSLKMFADVLLTAYNALKADFETEVNSRITDSEKHVTVDWLNLNNVSPYIISL